MDTELDKLIAFVKQRRKIKQEDLADQIGINPSVFSRYKKEREEDLVHKIRIAFPKEAALFYTDFVSIPDKIGREEQAMLKVLVVDHLKLKAQVTGRQMEDLIKEFDQDTRLAYRGL